MAKNNTSGLWAVLVLSVVVACFTATLATAATTAPKPPINVCNIDKDVQAPRSGTAQVDCSLNCDAMYNVSVHLHSDEEYGASVGSYPVWFGVCGNRSTGFRVTGDCHLQYYGFVSGTSYNVRLALSTTGSPNQVIHVSENVTQISNCTV